VESICKKHYRIYHWATWAMPPPPWPDTNIYKRISETHILRHEARPGVATTPSHTFQKVLSLDPTGGLPSP